MDNLTKQNLKMINSSNYPSELWSRLINNTYKFHIRNSTHEGKVLQISGSCFFSFNSGFTLWKNNLETLDAIQIIARAIRVQPSDISYAGIKDKRAITMQFMAVNQPLHR